MVRLNFVHSVSHTWDMIFFTGKDSFRLADKKVKEVEFLAGHIFDYEYTHDWLPTDQCWRDEW